MTTKKKEDNDAKKGGNSYEVDAKYSFKDLVSVSPPSWQLFSGNGRVDDDVKEDKKEEKKTKKERTPTKPSMSLNVAIEDEERRKTPIKKKALMTSKSKALSMKPKLGKMSFVDAFFLPGELERVKRKSREWGAAAWSARGDTQKTRILRRCEENEIYKNSFSRNGIRRWRSSGTIIRRRGKPR
jgi:hypothetical protein